MKIKFMLAINEKGDWAVAGWDGATDLEMCDAMDTVFENRFHANTHWIEVEVPIPNAKLVGKIMTKAQRLAAIEKAMNDAEFLEEK